MLGVGLRISSLFAFPAIGTVASVQSFFEQPCITFGGRVSAQLDGSLAQVQLEFLTKKSQSSLSSTLVWKLCRIGLVWAMPASGIPDTILMDITQSQGRVSEGIPIVTGWHMASPTLTELDEYLTDTITIRSLPTTSVLLAEIAEISEFDYAQVFHHLISTNVSHTPVIVKTVMDELLSTPRSPLATTSSQYQPTNRIMTWTPTIATCRTQESVRLENFAPLKVNVQDHDLILLNHRIREDSDFPTAPFWHAEYETQRAWLDKLLSMKEDSATDYFAHAIFLKKLLREWNLTGSLPHAGKLRTILTSAITEANKLMKAGANFSPADELKRILRVKIAHIIPGIATTDEQMEAVRCIKLESLSSAGILQTSDLEVAAIISNKMRQVLDDEDHSVDLDEDYI